MSTAARVAGWRRLANRAGPWAAPTSGGSTPTLTLTYDSQLSRIRVAVSGLDGSAATVLIDRSVDQVRWTTVRGGNGATVTSQAAAVDDYEFDSGVLTTYRVRSYNAAAGLLDTVTGTMTATLTVPWLKFVARPFLNRSVTLGDYSDITRAARNGVFAVVGRTLPVVVSDTRGSRQVTIELQVVDADEADDLDVALASGDPVFWHAPADCPVPTMHAAVGDVSVGRRSTYGPRRYVALPLIECAAPGPDVVGATSTWQTVLNAYPTWGDVLAAHATWGDLLELIGDPAEVIVP